MPIAPDKMKLYPGGSIHSPEWRAIRNRIAARAKYACEGCGVRNHALGGRDANGIFHPVWPTGDRSTGYTWPAPGDEYWCGKRGAPRKLLRIIRIVCTVAHRDCALVDHSDENLAFWCQQCHNRHDCAARHSQAVAARAAGQAELFPAGPLCQPPARGNLG